MLDAARKYVASTTLTEPLPWRNSVLLPGDATASVAELRASGPTRRSSCSGSGALLRSLLAVDLVDELRLSVHPLILGAGTRLFDPDGPRRAFSLADSVVTTTGVLIATYHRARA